MLGKGHLVSEDIGKGGVSILPFEGRRAEKHLVHQDSQGPPVHRAGVTASFDDFWRDVLLGANKGVGAEVGDARPRVDGREGCRGGPATTHDHGRNASGIGLLGEVEVGQHDVSGLMQEDICDA